MSTGNPAWSAPEQRESPWAAGLTTSAALLMGIGGVWHALAGIAAVMNDEVYVRMPGYVYVVDLSAWGWMQLLLGILVVVAGFAVLKGQPWARVLGIVLACLSLIANFVLVPSYPFWSLLIIALDVAIIWALSTYRRAVL